MKKLAILLVVLLFTAGATFAQERGGGERPSKSMNGRPGGQGRMQMDPEQMAQRQTQRLVEELKLNKDQEAKVLAINKKYIKDHPFDFQKMRDATDEERAKMREEMRKVQDNRNKEIKAVLTPEQAKLYEQNLKKREEMRKNGQGSGGRPQGGQ